MPSPEIVQNHYQEKPNFLVEALAQLDSIPRENTEGVFKMEFPLEMGFTVTSAALDKIQEFAKKGSVELSYKKERGILKELFRFTIMGHRADLENVVRGIQNIIDISVQ